LLPPCLLHLPAADQPVFQILRASAHEKPKDQQNGVSDFSHTISLAKCRKNNAAAFFGFIFNKELLEAISKIVH
jgi:hypothetical protein